MFQLVSVFIISLLLKYFLQLFKSFGHMQNNNASHYLIFLNWQSGSNCFCVTSKHHMAVMAVRALIIFISDYTESR